MRVTGVERLVPLGALGGPVDEEAAQLGLGGRLTGAEVDPAVGHEVERGDALGHAGGVVEVERQLDDAVAEADAGRALAGGGEEHLGADECEYSSRKWCSTSHT